MRKIRLSLKDRSYDIIIGRGLLKDCGSILKRLNIGRDAVVITNRPILRYYKKIIDKSLKSSGLSVQHELVPDSERAKSNEYLSRLIKKISIFDRTKEIFIVAFGGGVIGDLSGFVAAVYKRGIPYVQIPTTLLAQVDSAIGGKVAIDLTIAKNLMGAFYQPKAVLSDISLIKSLSSRQIRNGLAEVIKYGVIKDRTLFEYIENNYKKILKRDEKALEYIVFTSSRIKARIVEKDEFDKKGLRIILNYGHTIGHAIEAAGAYSKRYNHGEAIAIGMIIAAEISSRLGLIKNGEVRRIEALIEKVGLPTTIKGLEFSKIYESHLRDKKFAQGKNRFVLPTRIGSVKIFENVPDFIIRHALRSQMK